MNDSLLKPAIVLPTGSTTIQGLATMVEAAINKALTRFFSGAYAKYVSVVVVNDRLQYVWTNLVSL